MHPSEERVKRYSLMIHAPVAAEENINIVVGEMPNHKDKEVIKWLS
jgi:hypothetical protein